MQQSQDEQLQSLLQQILSRLQQFEKSTEWQPNGVNPCPMFKREVDGRIASKGISPVSFPLQKIVDFLRKPQTLKKLNPNCLQVKDLHEVKDRYKVSYQQYQGVWPVASRDFVTLNCTFRVNGKVYLGVKSCNYPYAEVKGFVRGQVYIAGYIIEPIDQKSCQVTYISDTDLKGAIPNILKKLVSERQGSVADLIGRIMLEQQL